MIEFRFHHPITRELSALAPGFHPLECAPGGLALDFIRLNLFDRGHFLTLPCDGPGCGADLNEVLDGVIGAAIADPECWVYVYGEPWAPAPGSDRAEARATIALALERGIDAFEIDSGDGEAASLLGEVLRAERATHRVHILARVRPRLLWHS